MPRGFAPAKVDGNQRAIIEALQAIPGVRVQSLAAVGGGCPDLLVSIRGRNLLLEVKVPNGPRAKRRWVLTDDQELWHATWTGQVEVVCTVDEALAVVRAAMKQTEAA